METTERLLKDYTDTEKGAYLGAIASLATADHVATEEELEYMGELAESAGVSEQQKAAVVRAASELSGEELIRCLDILKDSDLRFSLVTDLISFAESDKNYSGEEKQSVEKIAAHLNINQEQFSLLDQFVKKTNETQATPEEVSKPGFLASLGLQDKFKSAGINGSSLGKGLLGIAAPLLLAGLFRRKGGGGGLSSMFNQGGGGGIGGLFNQGGGGGIGSLISTLSGGRGFGNAGGLLSRLFGR